MSIIFYHVFLWLYKTGIRLIAPWNKKARLWLDGRKDLFSRMQQELGVTGTAKTAGGPIMKTATAEATAVETTAGTTAGTTTGGAIIWMHCSSLGEFEQGRPVLEGLRRQSPECRIVLSFFSPSGYETRKNYEGADHVFYLPLDSRRNARQFIDLVKPTLVLWVKYDYWYYFLVELKKRGIAVLLISGVFRADQPFFRWYGRLHRYMLDCFRYLFVQTEASKRLLGRLGITANLRVTGDTRFDRVIEISEGAAPLPLIEAFCGERVVIVAGSTWEEDEEELDHYANTHPEMRFLIAPHEIEEERLQEVELLFRHSIRYSAWEKQAGNSGAQGPSGKGRGAGGRLAGTAMQGVVGGWPEPNVLII
ncbi:MAG TPA: glycosyltransferase N-terminal domain-containing protein, partial [Puia sp.]|nr:glycosyltransferase N-terminal domain-containing protein [Puia sp.]